MYLYIIIVTAVIKNNLYLKYKIDIYKQIIKVDDSKLDLVVFNLF